ncbi:Nucleotidylyl transferase [Gigaspora margarita]|uniref:Nucleotidylyl transferase n=1 Tax=Gigaspora margarita TaxID=4874 RepID=A0A8H4EM76_GIGMA|nr:Nucleotidylyl transferase [Gigaspora margarita]
MNEYISIEKLVTNLSQAQKTQTLLSKPFAVLLISGSFNPIHKRIIQVLKIAKQFAEKKYEIVAGYISPFSNEYVNEAYPDEAIPFYNRLQMIQTAIEEESWIEINQWESLTSSHSADCNLIITRLSELLNKNNKIKEFLNEKQLKIIYVCGSDQPLKNNSKEQLKNLENFELIIVERYFKEKNDNWKNKCIETLSGLYNNKWKNFENNISYIEQNDNNPDITISSTKIRQKENNWEQMCDFKVTEYIKKNKILEFNS